VLTAGSPSPSASLSAIQPALSFPLEIHALNYWMKYFVTRPDELPEVGHEYFTHVLPLWEDAAPDSCIYLALAAVSHAAFGRARQTDKAIEDAVRLYTRTIAKTNDEIRSPPDDGLDQLIMSIMLLGFYEVSRLVARQSLC